MKDSAPSLQEIAEVKALERKLSFKELNESGFFKDKRKTVIVKTMTEILMRNSADDCREEVWKFCKQLAGYAHAPVELKEYQRMQKHLDNSGIIDAVLAGLKENYFPFSGRLPDIQGYYYCIALLSQTDYRRNECLDYLENLSGYFTENLPDHAPVLKRNMKMLKNDFPDLERLFNMLDEEQS